MSVLPPGRGGTMGARAREDKGAGNRSAHFERARRHRDKAMIAAVLVAAVTPLARAELKVFSYTASLWSDPINWSPSGVPITGDDVLITGGSVDMSLDFDLSLRSLTFAGTGSRTLGNATTGSANAILNLTNVPGSGTATPSYIAVTQPGGVFTIAGQNIDPTGVGTGRIGLQIGSSGTWAAAAGASL